MSIFAQQILIYINMYMNRVTFEIAQKLKSFGYTKVWNNGAVLYDTYGELVIYNSATPLRDKGLIVAPTLDEVTRWLRSEHKIDILPYRHSVGDGGYYDEKYMCSIVVPPMFFEREKDNKEFAVSIPNTDTFDSFDDAVAESVAFVLILMETKRNGWKIK